MVLSFTEGFVLFGMGNYFGAFMIVCILMMLFCLGGFEEKSEEIQQRTVQYQEVTADYSGIQAIVDSVCEKYAAVGAQVAVVDDKEIVGTYSYGWATYGTDGMTSEHKMRVASISKIVVGMAAMILQEEGIVDIDEDIGAYWDTAAINPYYPDTPVTMRMILSHTSTIIPYNDAADYDTVRNRLSYGYFDAQPGSMYSYCYNNYAFGVLGATLETAADECLDSIVDEKIFSVLDIDASFAPGDTDNTDKLVTLYNQYGEPELSVQVQKDIHLSDKPGDNAAHFAGGLTACAGDIAKLIVLMTGDGVYEGERVLTVQSVATMEDYLEESYSDGSYQAQPLFYSDELYQRNGIYFHTGSAYGAYNCFSYDPETGDGVVVLTSGAVGTVGQCEIYAICDEINTKIYELIGS